MTTAEIQAALVLRRIADQQGVDVRFTRSIARAIGDDRIEESDEPRTGYSPPSPEEPNE
jgi:hypothetical protein